MIKSNTLFSDYSMSELRALANKRFKNKLHNSGVDPNSCANAFLSWVEEIRSLPKSLRTEEKLEPAFIKKVLCETLGHKLLGEAPFFTVIPKLPSKKGIPDIKLGSFSRGTSYENCRPNLLLELKGPEIFNLHAPQTSRPDKKSPVEQVVSDMFNTSEECQFSIVTNMVDFEILSRTYAEKKSLVVSLENIQSEDDVYLLHLLLGPDSVLIKSSSLLLEFKQNEKQSESISKNFYDFFSECRNQLLTITAKYLKSQERQIFINKYLSQIIFCIYAETTGLIPEGCLLQVLKLGEKKWQIYRKFCNAMNKGATINGQELFGYNGGLFAPTKVFEQNHPKELLEIILPLLEFKFEHKDGKAFTPDQIRDCLGKVLEHAMEVNETVFLKTFTEEATFSESRKAQATKNEGQKKGVFYTPRFVTKYMVSRALELLRDTNKNISKTTWFDPTCGSGAFLIEIFEQLVEHEANKVGLRKGMAERNSNFEKILSTIQMDVLNRIQGNDFDELASQMSRLNISMKCCRPHEKLPKLYSTIQDDDFLFSDQSSHYDVIISNPPYMQWRYLPEEYRSKLSEDDLFKELAEDSADYSAFFFKTAYDRLKPGGILAFIATNKLLSTKQGERFRVWLEQHFEIVEILDFRKKIFKRTAVETAIFILKKRKGTKSNYKYRDVFSYTNSESHLEVKNWTPVPNSLIKTAPYKAIPSRTTPAILSVYNWYKSNGAKFITIGDIFESKSGIRITDFDSNDVIYKKPTKEVTARYEPLYDGPSVVPKSGRFIVTNRWVEKHSNKLSTWRTPLSDRLWYVIVKEKCIKPAVISVSSKCPAVLNSLNIIYPKPNSMYRNGSQVAKWLRGPLSEAWVELWFGANRTHSNQRWKDVYYGTIPIPKSPKTLEAILPNWVLKELLYYLGGEFRIANDTAEQKQTQKRKRMV